MRIACAAVLLVLFATFSAAGEHVAGRPQGETGPVRRITWQDVAPLHARLVARGITSDDFASRIDRLAADDLRRVHLGDLDHLVFYLLQSRRFTAAVPIEPALSAKALVDRLDGAARAAFLRDPASARGRVSDDVSVRVGAFLRAARSPDADARLTYFARLLAGTTADAGARERFLLDEYLRVMRFVYEKEFGTGRTNAAAAATLYRTRGLSTDTAVEAGFLVSQGLGVLRGLDPTRRVRRVLVVGAGLDLAPRTALLEAAPPQSYQPWAVLDALVALGLARLDDIAVVAADINPRVVEHLRDAHAAAPELTLVSGIAASGPVDLAQGYREYFAAVGATIASGAGATAPSDGNAASVPRGHLHKRLQVSAAAARAVRAERLDVITERLTGEPFDLVIATNVFPYFDDDALSFALSDIAGMLTPGGVLLHNEARPGLQGVAAALGLPLSQSRHAVIATVRGAAPLGDSVWLHVRSGAAER